MMAARTPYRDHDVWHFPVHYMRGGTSTGAILWEKIAPRDVALREELLRHLMGVPLAGECPGNTQTTGLGRGPATSNKVFFADIERTASGERLVSTLAQLAATHDRIDWSVNCGNMSSALQLWALETGLVARSDDETQHLTIFNTNTGVVTHSRMTTTAQGFAMAPIPGVMGAHPAVELFLQAPVGAKTGALLPTGSAVDTIEGIDVSCVDVAVPMVIVSAADLGKTGYESVAQLSADTVFMERLKRVWVAAGEKMRLRHADGRLMSQEEIARSETVPKVCLIAEARQGGDLCVRYLTPQTLHGSLAVSGGCCLAAATLVPGTVAHRLAPKALGAVSAEVDVALENPAGILATKIVAWQQADGTVVIESAAYQRSAQVLLAGYVPLYQPSAALRRALESQHDAAR
ncbi:PrpF domain-containing protein [Halomonas sp. 707D7]|uniref:PrpF domain-containing protein n=3 Tax=unclassified Halomonas TaxID=2609666 RepID=UPI00209DA5B0|nr:PrpF domain-containing protein [Halomonas sp. 707D7]MCP1315155.1 hypothetical protein [Halomonas sp. 707D7]